MESPKAFLSTAHQLSDNSADNSAGKIKIQNTSRMKLSSFFALNLISIRANSNSNIPTKREEMQFNVQVSKNGLFKFTEDEDLEKIRSKHLL